LAGPDPYRRNGPRPASDRLTRRSSRRIRQISVSAIAIFNRSSIDAQDCTAFIFLTGPRLAGWGAKPNDRTRQSGSMAGDRQPASLRAGNPEVRGNGLADDCQGTGA